MKVYFFSNTPWATTGYANQCALFAPRIKALGHEVVIGAFYGLQGAPIKWKHNIWVLPSGRDTYGNDIIVPDAKAMQADIVLTLMDVWVLSPDITKHVRWCPWFPVDHQPVPPGVLSSLMTAYQTIAYSKFGVNELQKAGITTAMYVPHGVDTKVFKPRSKVKAREKLGGCPPDDFLVGLVAANKGNPSRKAFDQQIRAFAEFNRRHPNSMLYIHTDFDGAVMGVPLAPIIEQAGIPPQCIGKPDSHRYTRGLLGDDYMAAVYNACDVVLNASKGEGFGIPILEAQASGTPVIVTDFSSMPELCFAGWKVPYSDKEWTYQHSYQVTPSVPALVDALEDAYSLSKSKRADMRQQARAGALAYDADVVTTEYWKPALQAIEARIAGEKKATDKPEPVEMTIPAIQAVAA